MYNAAKRVHLKNFFRAIHHIIILVSREGKVIAFVKV